MIDIHNHILPGVDDGSSSWEESLDMARCAVQDGIHTIVCTPHINVETDNVSILSEHAVLRQHLQQRLLEEGIQIRLLAGAEWMLTPDLACVVRISGQLGTSRAFLFELSPFMPPFVAMRLIVEARGYGLQPVLAHPERYPLLGEDNHTSLKPLMSKGCILQITAGSLLGNFGKSVKKVAEQLVCAYPDAIVLASDAHNNTTRKPLLKAAYQALDELLPGSSRNAQEKLNILLGL